MPVYANLPGTSVEITDQGLRITRAPSGPKVVLLGFTTSTDSNATAYVPYAVSEGSLTTAYRTFKNADDTPSELCKALMECYITGSRNIELMNILPTASGASLGNDDRYGYLDKAYENLFNHDPDIIVPVGAHLDMAVSNDGDGFSRNYGYQLANFCYRATQNNNTCTGVIGVDGPTASASGTPTIAEIESWVYDLENYTNVAQYDGTTDDDDDGKPENYSFVATTDGHMPSNFAGGDVDDTKGNKVDIGAYISVVAAAVRASNDAGAALHPTLGYYNSDGAAAYAGLVGKLPAKSAPTNKVVDGTSMQNQLSYSQANRLCGSRFVGVFEKPKGVVVASAMTGAYNISIYHRSDFVRLSTVRIMHDAINIVRAACDPFIGEPNNAPQRNAMSTAIEGALVRMRDEGALRRYDFTVYSTPTDQVLGRATVELTLVPSFELQQITVYVSLAAE